jgi:formylmethanofuran dehydrogenase subunit E
MILTSDPIRDAMRHDAESERWLSSRPRCCECGEYIQDEHYYDFHDRFLCEQCLEENHRRFTDDYE